MSDDDFFDEMYPLDPEWLLGSRGSLPQCARSRRPSFKPMAALMMITASVTMRTRASFLGLPPSPI